MSRIFKKILKLFIMFKQFYLPAVGKTYPTTVVK